MNLQSESPVGRASWIRTAYHAVEGSPLTRFLTAWAFLAIVTLAAVRIGHPFWLTNDDVTMSALASGGYTGRPTGQLGFVNGVLGWPVAWLYGIVPGIAWYAWIMTSTLVIALAAISRAVRGWVWLAWLSIATVVAVWCSLRPNFTITAFAAASAGLLLYLDGIRRRRLSFMGLVIFATGAAWRSDSALLVVLLMLPMAMMAAWERQPPRRLWFAVGSWALLPISAMAVAQLNRLACVGESCASWREFLDFNSARSSFQTAPRGDLLAALGDSTGTWSRSATNLFVNFSFPDSQLFSLPNLSIVDSAFPLFLEARGGGFDSHLEYVAGQVSVAALLLVAAILGMAVPTLIGSCRKGPFVARVTLVLIWPMALLALVSLVRLPFAVAFGSAVGVIAAIAVLCGWEVLAAREAPRPVWLPLVGGVAAAAVAVSWLAVGPVSIASIESEARSRYEDGAEVRARYNAAAQGVLVFGQGNLADYFVDNPFEAESYSGLTQPLLSGWPVFSPGFTARRIMLGFTDVEADLRAGRSADGRPVLFAGSGTNATELANLLSEEDLTGHKFAAAPIAPLTNVDDVIAGETFLWRFN